MSGNAKRKSRTSGGPSAKKSRPKWKSSKFGQILERAGLTLGGDQQNLLSVYPAVFQKQLASEFKKSASDTGVSMFIQGLRDYLESPTRFKSCLLPTAPTPEADVRGRFGGLDSLMRLLLGIDDLQPSVMDVLLEWLPDYMSDDADAMSHGIGMEENLAMPKLMLSQLRWLDGIVKGQDLCEKLLQVVEIATPEMQREIIVALPEILDDPQHNEAAQKLKALLATSSNLTAPIVDALSNLNIEKDLAAEVLDTALHSLQSANILDLPTVLRFIHEHMTPSHAQEVVAEIRLKINLDFSPVPVVSSTPLQTQPQTTSEGSNYFVVLDTIRSSISFQKAVADGWIKALSSVSLPGDHRVIDVFVLFVLFSITSHRKTVERLFVAKIRAGCLDQELMNTVFSSHPEALREFFPSLLVLCGELLCSSSLTVACFGMCLYQHIFNSFTDIYCRQEVVEGLVIHINNGVKSEVDHALDVILLLMETHCKTLLRFESLIKMVLDFLGHLSIQQIRKVYQILATLAFADLDHTSSLQSEIHTIIRKQLTHFEPRYRHIGVVASVMTIHQIAGHSADEQDSINTNHHLLASRRQQMAKMVLEEVMVTCSRSEECSILFCDEMSCIVAHLEASILGHLSERVTSLFQDAFLLEMTDGAPQGVGIPLDFLYGLDSTDEGSIVLNVLPMVVAARTGGMTKGGGTKSKEGLVGMAALFRLLRKCEKQLNGNLEVIDALLGCPVLLCSEKIFLDDAFENLPEVQRIDICLSIFFSINWFRELICAFAAEADIDMKGKVIIRLRNITDLQDRLGQCMAVTPGFCPPSLTVSETVPSFTRAKSSKSNVTLASMTEATLNNIDKDVTAMEKTTATSISMEKLHPFFRPLDLSVFKAFSFGSLSRTILDSNLLTKEQEEVMLEQPQLIFLLHDLCKKLTSSFTTFRHWVRADECAYTSAELATAMTDLVPALCVYLETNSSFFQAQLVENDGIMDMGSGVRDYPQFCLVCHLLLKAFSSYFGWSSLSDPQFSKQLKSSLNSVMGRISSQSPSSSSFSLQTMALEACKYFQHFSSYLPTLTCGHALAQILVSICKTCKAEEIRPLISSVCGSLLQRPWTAAESTQLRSHAITYLLKQHIEWSSDLLKVVETLAADAASELLGEDALKQSSKYPTLNIASFSWFYRAMMAALVNQLKTVSLSGKAHQLEEDEVLEDKFYVIQVSARVFSILVDLVQSFSKKPVLSTALKLGKQYVEVFMRCAMPVLDILLRPRKDEVIGVLKSLQHSTRFLQHCCSHSKVTKDINLINHVPQLKRSLEMLLFRVKELMATHNCQDAFWLGILKNRDLKGQEILSQQIAADEEEEDENAEEEENGDEANTTGTTSSKDDKNSEASDDIL